MAGKILSWVFFASFIVVAVFVVITWKYFGYHMILYIAALQADHAFMLKGDVFTQDVIDTWITYKKEREIDPVQLRPHPWEFYLYYDI